MRLKIILLASKYMAKFVLTIGSTMAAIYATVYVVKELTGDSELGVIIVFALMGLGGAFATCYDIAKNKIDTENRNLIEQLARKS